MLERHAKTMSDEKTTDTESDESFYAMENAKIVREAEKYYRHMFEGGEITWNIRDTHMCDCLQDLLQHNGPESKAVIWAHNSHIGDARETDSRRAREINIGQLVRERFGIKNTFNIGFTTYTGTVTAADSWDMDPDFKRVRPSLNESVEFLLHDALINDSTMTNDGQYFLLFRTNNQSIQLSKELHTELHKKRLERAIGVIYRPRTERQSHYFEASISTQFDCVIHVEATCALRPLEIHPVWSQAEKDHVPDTFPMNV
jgi:erythromycin esterase-like protein